MYLVLFGIGIRSYFVWGLGPVIELRESDRVEGE